MATTSNSAVSSTTVLAHEAKAENVLRITLRRRPERIRRAIKISQGNFHVEWTEDTVDNENMNKKKSNSTFLKGVLLVDSL